MVLSLRIFFSVWPGTLGAWRHGDLRSLLSAISFGLLLSIGWTATIIWPLWFSPWRVVLLWSIAVIAAVLSVVHNATRGLLRAPRPRNGCPDAAFVEAQSLYLQASYFEAEQLIAPYCRPDAYDAEAAILMASILRRTGRYSQALSILDELSLLDCGMPWFEEIEREKKLSKQQKLRSQTDGV
jgi:cytochrome c-type biogenesis protein CcmH/NrfG